jgi:hypothetical protein
VAATARATKPAAVAADITAAVAAVPARLSFAGIPSIATVVSTAGGGGGGGSSFVEPGAKHVKSVSGVAPTGDGRIAIYW